MRIDVYDRQDNYLHTIGTSELISFVWTDELNGEDSVAISTTWPIGEGMRLIWKDRTNTVHEHVCQDPQAVRESGAVYYTDTALNSICELFGDYIEDKRPYGYTYALALTVCLEPTRWALGTVDMPGKVSDSLTFYATDCRTALNSILESGGELETEIEVGTGGITRKVGIRQHRGRTDGHRRFSYGKDLVSITRTEHWGAITACYGYGKGVETDAGGYGRKLTFADINGGKAYVEDAAALQKYGRPDGKGGLAHVFGTYENQNCEDAAQLKSETEAHLQAHKEPGVTYEASVVDLLAMGREWEAVGVGDDCQIVDTSFTPALRCEGRVSKMVTDMLGGTIEVTLGNVTETMGDLLANQSQELSSLKDHSAQWDVAASTPPAYLQQIMDGLNAEFNKQGMSYRHTSFENGDIWASVPMDSTGKPTVPGGTAIQMCAQGFRIADGTLDDGTWDWQVFGTGEGFTANSIVAGTIRGGNSYWNLETGELLFKQGMIADTSGSNTWNLTNGNMTLGGNLTISGGTIGDGGGNSWNLTTGDMVLAGNLTVRGGKIMDASGRNVWDLANSDMSLDSPNTSITGGIIRGAGNNYWNLDTGDLNLDFVPDSVQTQLNRLESDVEDAQWDATMARNITNRISFTSSGMQIEGTNGQTQSIATYTSDGFTVDAETCTIGSSSGSLCVKNWGMYAEFDSGVRMWITDGSRYGGGAHFLAAGSDYTFMVNKDGAYWNGQKLAVASA